VDIHIEFDLASVIRDLEYFRRAREKLLERTGGDAARVDRYLSDRLLRVLERFGELYVLEVSAHLDNILRLRETLKNVYDAVVRGEPVETSSIPKLFEEMEAELGKLQPPSEHAKSLPALEIPPRAEAPPPARAPMDPPVHPAWNVVRALGQDLAAVQKLPAVVRRALTEAAKRFPELVRKAISAESSATIDALALALERAGFTPEEIAAAREGAEAVNLDRALERLAAAQKAAGMSDAQVAAARARIEALDPAQRRPAVDAANPSTIAEERAAVKALGDPALRAAVGRSRTLARLARENPSMLRALWAAFQKKPRDYRLWKYAVYIGRIIRGLHGEYGAAFRLGKDFVLLKGPDFEVTVPGTDLVALAKIGGEVFMIDNKAFFGDFVSSVTALVRNFPKNLGDDLASFENVLGGRDDTPPEIWDAMTRLSKAARAISDLTAKMSKEEIAEEPTQKQIEAILKENNIRRVVTNAGGNVTGLSAALEDAGLLFYDVNNLTDSD
jgi:hypothetical protein